MDKIKRRMESREAWIDLAKVLTMLLVIIGHSAYYVIDTQYGGIRAIDNTLSISKSAIVINYIVDYICSFHMPFFMALSGMTFSLSYKADTVMSLFFKKKIKRLLLPFITVTLFLSVPLKYMSGYYEYSTNILSDIFYGQFLLFGNSHLWFVVSLFWISIVFGCFVKKNIQINLKFWIISIIVSYIGIWLERKGCYLGLPGAMKNFVYFALGYAFFYKIKIFRLNAIETLLSWGIMIIVYATIVYSNRTITYFRVISYLPIAIWGCINMVATTKLLLKINYFTDSKFYRSLNKHSYGLYLYSDPFNYVLIVVLIMLFGNDVIESDFINVFAFIFRIITSLILAYIVIFFLLNVVRPMIAYIQYKFNIVKWEKNMTI